MKVPGHDPTFVLETRRDVIGAHWAIARLRRIYPRARVMLIADGPEHTAELRDVAADWQAEFYPGENLCAIQHGGMMLHRRLMYFLVRPTMWLIKMDWDTKLWRPFRELPTHGMFGHVINNEAGQRTCQGGCYGLAVRTCRELYDRLVFTSPALDDYASTWAKGKLTRARIPITGMISEDWVCGYGVTKIGHPITECAEFGSRWKEPPANRNLQFAVTHPHKAEALGQGGEHAA